MVATRILCLEVGLDSGLESLGIGAYNLGDLVTALEKQEGGHGADAKFLCDIGDFVNVELEEACIRVLVREPVCMLELCSLGLDMQRLT